MQTKNENQRLDLHQTITDSILAALEAGIGEFKMPWHRQSGAIMRPVNIASGNAYQGINILQLWVTAERKGYHSPVWGTFKQWLDHKTLVRKGEKATLGIVYKEFSNADTDAASGEETERRLRLAKAFWLFNAEQVDGYQAVLEASPPPARIDPIDAADQLLRASGAVIREGGDEAFYRPSTDEIILPDRSLFTGSPTRSATEAFYAVALHETIHWTGAKSRLDRDLAGRFGEARYAAEELVAELGAAILCADLGVSTEIRPDHAQYIATWITLLKKDNKAIFTASAHAQRAAAFLLDMMPPPSPTRPGVSGDTAHENPSGPQ